MGVLVMPNVSDQWNSYGDCSLCRREPYCNKPCNANKRRVSYNLVKTINDVTGFGEVLSTYDNIMSKHKNLR